MPCSSLTYNAKEIRLLLKEAADEVDENIKWTVEWIIIDPASFTGKPPPPSMRTLKSHPEFRMGFSSYYNNYCYKYYWYY